jgi:hypothetical protein
MHQLIAKWPNDLISSDKNISMKMVEKLEE